MTQRRTAVITGASSGIGAATARRLAREGFDLILGARRRHRLEDVARETGGRALPRDVTEPSSIERFAAEIRSVNVLVNNAGLESGPEPIAELSHDRVETMWATNVAGLL